MVNQQLVSFINTQIRLGTDKEVIKRQLLSNGWTNKDIDEAYKEMNKNNYVSNKEVEIYSNFEDEKDNSGLKIVSIILTIIAIALGGFIIYKGFIEKNKAQEVVFGKYDNNFLINELKL